MKAAVYSRYGPPDVVQIQDVEKPVPKDNEILIDVRAASVNPLSGSCQPQESSVTEHSTRPISEYRTSPEVRCATCWAFRVSGML